jgi:hypothetical protein
VGNFIAELEPLHQSEQFVAHVGVLIICPDGCEVGLGEVAEILPDSGGVEDFIDGSGAPFGSEDNEIFEDGIILEVEANAEVVEVAAELEFVFTTLEAMGIAESEELSLGDVVAGVSFEDSTDTHPGFG